MSTDNRSHPPGTPPFAARLSRRALLTGGAAAAVGVLASPVASRVAAQTLSWDAGDGIALGAYIEGDRDDGGRIDRYVGLVGRTPALVGWYLDWAYGGNFNRSHADLIAERGAMPMLTWEPKDHTIIGPNQPAFTLARILGGEYDAFITGWARDVAAWGKPIFIRLAHEMNGDWYPWSPGVNGNTTPQYAAMWRYVVDIFRREGATNVRWVWAPNAFAPTLPPLDALYPGDAYVDWVGTSVFNWGTSETWGRWAECADVLTPVYEAATRLTNKPLMLSELGAVEAGGSKARWITQALMRDIPTRFPLVRGVVWFHDHSRQANDWRVNTSLSALDAFKRAAMMPAYRGRFS